MEGEVYGPAAMNSAAVIEVSGSQSERSCEEHE